MTKREFHHLVTSLQSGNDKPWGDLYLKHRQYCVDFLKKKFNCANNDAQDIYMDAMIKFRNEVLRDKVSNANIKGYITKIAQNECLKRLNKQKRTTTNDVFDVDKVENYLAQQNVQDDAYDPLIQQEAAQAFTTQQKRKINALVWAKQQLNPRCQQLLTATIVEGIKLSKLLLRFKFSNLNVAKTTKSRCKKKLESLVAQYLNNYT